MVVYRSAKERSFAEQKTTLDGPMGPSYVVVMHDSCRV